MKRKLLSLFLVFSIIASLFSTSAFAAVDLNSSSVSSAITKISDNLLSLTAAKRTEYFNLLSTYLQTNDGIDALVAGLQDSSKVPSALTEFYNNYSAALTANKDDAIFLLKFMKCIPEEKRKESLTDFENKSDVTISSTDTQNALNNVYVALVPANTIDMLRNDHGIGANTILTLFTALKGSIYLTNTSTSSTELKLKTSSVTFDNAVQSYLSGTVINGTTITDTYSLSNVLCSAFNAADPTIDPIRSDITKVLREIGLFEPSTVGGGGYGGGSGGGSSGGSSSGSTNGSGTDNGSGTEPETPTVNPPVIAAPVATSTFTDVQNTWSEPYVGALESRHIFAGYPDGGFHPEAKITRQEIAVVLVKALGIESELKSDATVNFTDKDSIADWSEPYIALLDELGIFKGYDDGGFHPEATLTREEFAALVARVVKQAPKSNPLSFSDKSSFSSWSQDNINTCSALGIVSGYEDGSFKPKEEIKRSESAVMIYRLMYIDGYLS
ncbi:MAG: S-layer homology domain-containing protein [Bacillota bacterium]|nr:S-layer homology domain-containing protein [Bacillota bacterium]